MILSMSTDGKSQARALASFIDSAPSPYHACQSARVRLEALGFQALEETLAWQAGEGRYFVERGGSLVAWVLPAGWRSEAGFRIVGAHTDSPNLRIKPRPESGRAGYRQLGVEIYGGVLLNSWLDRDLGLSGRAYVRSAAGPEQRLFRIDRPLLRVPQLAIHLDRSIKTEGLKLNEQEHMSPVYGLKAGNEAGFRELLSETLGVQPGDLLSWDAMCHDLTPSGLLGMDEEFVVAPRLDNLCSAHCALSAMEQILDSGVELQRAPMIALFDHEEVGSASRAGADSPLIGDLLERIVLGQGGGREEFHRALAASLSVSSDMAHATHPNYESKHDINHQLAINGGPVIKLNSTQRYATEGETEAIFQNACESAGVPFQKWASRSDLACGSTIGPVTASQLGIKTVDVGNPQLSMHSAREMCGSLDPGYLVKALAVLWSEPLG